MLRVRYLCLALAAACLLGIGGSALAVYLLLIRPRRR